MKASVFTWEYPPAIYGGAGVHAKYITTALAKRIKVEVRTLEVGPKPEIEGVNVLRYQSTLRGLATGDPRILKALQVLSFNMNMVADPIDAAIVHTHTWYTNFAGAMAKRIYGAKLVATVHSLEPLRPWKREQLGAGYELSLWLERDGLLACDAVIAVSRDMKADIQKAYPIPASRVAVIYNGVDPQKYYPRDGLESVKKFSIRRPYVFFVGDSPARRGSSIWSLPWTMFRRGPPWSWPRASRIPRKSKRTFGRPSSPGTMWSGLETCSKTTTS